MNSPGDRPSNTLGGTAGVLERDLVLAARRGDRAAFRTLAERYYRRVYRMLLAMTRNEDTAADLTQETFLKALVALPSFNLSSAFYTWLYRIATNAALDRMRRARTAGVTEAFDDHLDHGDVDVPGAAAMAVDPARAAATKEELEKLLAALDDLKPDHRQILVLREIEELSYQEIADVLEIRIGTVMSRLFTARARLREVLAARHGLKV